jgi:hypothetical protein
MESVLSLRDLRSSSSIVDMRYARSVLEQGYARLLNAKPDGVLDLVDCGDFWQTGSDVTLLHALLFLLEFVSTLNLPSVGSERIETKGRSVLIPIRIRGVGAEASIDIDFTVAHLWTFREDGAIAFQWFVSLDDACRALERLARTPQHE